MSRFIQDSQLYLSAVILFQIILKSSLEIKKTKVIRFEISPFVTVVDDHFALWSGC